MAYIPQRQLVKAHAEMRPQLREDIYALPSRRTLTSRQSGFIYSAVSPQLQEDLFLGMTGLDYVPIFVTRTSKKAVIHP
ncbi:MAG TPA: hypothetical protein VJC07_00820 [Candidatus Nanoarchaeia archaeon]|nr:hypothetical protein [Candidatus Nanoarchaeia archaeon]